MSKIPVDMLWEFCPRRQTLFPGHEGFSPSNLAAELPAFCDQEFRSLLTPPYVPLVVYFWGSDLALRMTVPVLVFKHDVAHIGWDDKDIVFVD